MTSRRTFQRAVDDARVQRAIRDAEAHTSGEIRVAVSRFFFGNVRRVAARAFERLGMSRTRGRNGVLFFVVPSRHRLVVLGDRAVHERTGDEFWQEVSRAVSTRFRTGDFTGGLVRGIEVTGARLAALFPREPGDVNELPDEVDRMSHDHEHEHHDHDHAHGDGHDKYRNPADLAAYLQRLEDPARAEWQKPDEVIQAIGVARGMTVGEIGAGPGFFTKKLAAAVGEQGRVLAAEVEPRILEVLRDRLAGIANVTPILADASDPHFPAASCDRIVVVNTYHHFPDGPAYLRRIAAALKPGGRIANVDFEDRETPVGPPLAHRVSRETFRRDAEAAGLAAVDDPAIAALALPYQYVVVLASRG